MNGTLYGTGVGPGDPELMTLRAVRLIRETAHIAVPGESAEDSAAYRIAVQAVPELAEKRILCIPMPMTRDAAALEASHRRGAARLEAVLETGSDVVFLTLGDPTIYSTFRYLQLRVQADGYPTALVSGVPSFCAAAARLNLSLAEWDQPLHILPAGHRLTGPLEPEGVYVLMKSGRAMPQVKQLLRESGRSAQMVENCGMPHEAVYRSLDEIPDGSGYYSLIISKGKRQGNAGAALRRAAGTGG